MKGTGFPWVKSLTAVAVTAIICLMWWWMVAASGGSTPGSASGQLPQAPPNASVIDDDGAPAQVDVQGQGQAENQGQTADQGQTAESVAVPQELGVELPDSVTLPVEVVTVHHVDAGVGQATVLASTSLTGGQAVAALQQHWLDRGWRVLGADSRSITVTNPESGVVTASMLPVEAIANTQTDSGPVVDLSDGQGRQTWLLISVLQAPELNR